MKWLQTHCALLCIMSGAAMTFIVFASWIVGYYGNALYGLHFDTGSCWTGMSAVAVSGVGILKWINDSINNSQKYDLPEGYGQSAEKPKILNRE